MKLNNLHEDRHERPEQYGTPSFNSMQYRKTRKIKPEGQLFTAATAKKELKDELRQSPESLEYDFNTIERLLKVIKTNPEETNELYDWLVDYQDMRVRVFSDGEKEGFKNLLIRLRK